ncbi:MAG: glycoside hydrolase family 2 protein [Bacteroidota bacterium]
MRYFLALLLVVLFMSSCKREYPIEQITCEDWEMGRLGESEIYPATVPGCVHTDLMANGLIEDPFYGDNESKLQWIGEASWVYSNNFLAVNDILEKSNQEIVFEGLDTYAKVYLNDSLIITADNMFRAWKANVKGIYKEGENHLEVVFAPPGEINDIKAEGLPYQLPDKRAFSRKAPYHFGWDWGPEFITCGIWKDTYFHGWDDFRIENVHVHYASIDLDPLPVQMTVSVDSDAEQNARLRLFNEESGDRIAFKKVKLTKGMNELVLTAEISNPELWWPAGLGDQKMYAFRTEVVGNGHSDAMVSNFGIREIALVREPDAYGESFYFNVNGLPVFMKGANYIPQDNFLTQVDTARYENLIGSVVDANMNMLRVWGGGIYENDIFYDLCDQNGILLWQDFMFACNMYPGDDAFLENVKQEAVENVSRLSNHPCIALWCGNNEVDEGWHNWGWQKSLGYSEADSAKVWSDYLKVFHDILPSVVEEYDPGTIYYPSSPMTGWGRDEAYTKGDVHYWGVWWGEEPFETYRWKGGRFVSEYGFQGMPPMETIESFTESGDRFPGSAILEAHQKHPRGTELIQKYMKREFIVPEDLDDYVYVSQVLQAEGMGQAFYAHRVSQPFCMGTLYWQLNDCWPVTSWASLDYYGRWKALHYHIKRAYAPLMIVAAEVDNCIKVAALNDHPKGLEVKLHCELQDVNGNIIDQWEELSELPPQSNTEIFSVPADGRNSEELVFVARLFQGDEEISNYFLYFTPEIDMDLPDPGLSFEVPGAGSDPVVIIQADKLARQVFLEAKGLDGRFEDNFFDMAAGETRRIRFIGDAGAEDLAKNIRIKSIYDSCN